MVFSSYLFIFFFLPLALPGVLCRNRKSFCFFIPVDYIDSEIYININKVIMF